MKISIIHPSRSRPKESFFTITKWLSMAENDIEYILSLDYSDIELAHYTLNVPENVKVVLHPNKSAIEAINNAAKIATGDLLIVVSDDFDCQQHWDTKLLNHIKGRTDFCAKTIDGIQETLITLPIMDRVYYERYGYIYNPDYQHMFSDQEMTAVAIMTCRYLKFPILFEHLHYSVGKFQKDAISVRNDSTWLQGETLFNERLKTNFGIENPVVTYDSIVWR